MSSTASVGERACLTLDSRGSRVSKCPESTAALRGLGFRIPESTPALRGLGFRNPESTAALQAVQHGGTPEAGKCCALGCQVFSRTGKPCTHPWLTNIHCQIAQERSSAPLTLMQNDPGSQHTSQLASLQCPFRAVEYTTKNSPINNLNLNG